MWQAIDASIAERSGLQPGEAFRQSIESRSALKRYQVSQFFIKTQQVLTQKQTPEDIANLVSFLASPKARNITGQSVLCDGGKRFILIKPGFRSHLPLGINFS